MYISELRIRHFRNFNSSRFTFRKGVNTLIGENGSGKTNALYALRLLLDDSLSRNSTNLREADFCRALNNWHGHWIVISVDFLEVDPSEGCQLLKHQLGHMDGTAKGTYTLYFRPKLDKRKILHEISVKPNSREEVRAYLNRFSVDDYEPIFTGRATADFLDDSMYLSLAGNVDSCVFPNPSDDDQNLLGVRIPPIHSEFSCTFAQAIRDVIDDLRGYRSNPLLGLLRGTESSIQIQDSNSIIETVTKLNRDISSLNCSFRFF